MSTKVVLEDKGPAVSVAVVWWCRSEARDGGTADEYKMTYVDEGEKRFSRGSSQRRPIPPCASALRTQRHSLPYSDQQIPNLKNYA